MVFITKADNELRSGGIVRRSMKFRGLWADRRGLTSAGKKEEKRAEKRRRKKRGRIRFAWRCCAGGNNQLDYRRGNVTRPRACGRGLNCVPFLSNFFNLSRLGQLITGRNDFRLTANGSFSVHDNDERLFAYAIANLGVTDCMMRPRASGMFDAKSMRKRERETEEGNSRSDSLFTSDLMRRTVSELNERF